MAKISEKVKQRIKKHTGTTDPDKIIEHFDKDEAMESGIDLSGLKKWQSDYSKSLPSSSDKIDLSGVKKVIKDIPKYKQEMKKKGEDPDAILSREEMNYLDKSGGDEKYNKLPFDGSRKSITKKVKSVIEDKKGSKPAAVIEKETIVSPGFTGRKVQATPDAFKRLQQSKMDSGKVEDDYRGSKLISNSALDAFTLGGLGTIGKGLMSKLGRKGAAKFTAKEAAEPIGAVGTKQAVSSKEPKVDMPFSSAPKSKPSSETLDTIAAKIAKARSAYGRGARRGDKELVQAMGKELRELEAKKQSITSKLRSRK